MEFMIIQLLSDHQFWYQPITLNLLNDIRFFSNILFLVQLRGFGQSISRLNLIKNWQKCQKTCPIFCSFGFNKSWSEYSLAQGFFYQVPSIPSIIHLMNLIQLAENFTLLNQYQEQVLVWFFFHDEILLST